MVKLMNEKQDEIRRIQYCMEKDINRRNVQKGTRYFLLRNGKDIFDEEYKTMLENALDMKNRSHKHTSLNTISGKSTGKLTYTKQRKPCLTG